jgi:hypothetical protein
MLSDRERARMAILSEQYCDTDSWILGLKVTGDQHVQMGALSMAVCLHKHPISTAECAKKQKAFWPDMDLPPPVSGSRGHGTLAMVGYRASRSIVGCLLCSVWCSVHVCHVYVYSLLCMFIVSCV